MEPKGRAQMEPLARGEAPPSGPASCWETSSPASPRGLRVEPLFGSAEPLARSPPQARSMHRRPPSPEPQVYSRELGPIYADSIRSVPSAVASQARPFFTFGVACLALSEAIPAAWDGTTRPTACWASLFAAGKAESFIRSARVHVLAFPNVCSPRWSLGYRRVEAPASRATAARSAS